jgi:hypothetical protein
MKKMDALNIALFTVNCGVLIYILGASLGQIAIAVIGSKMGRK